MIDLSVDCSMYPRMQVRADFDLYAMSSKNVDEFTSCCGAELEVALLGIIVRAEDEYARIIQTMCKKRMTYDERISIGEFLMDYVNDIDEEKIREFRIDVMDKIHSGESEREPPSVNSRNQPTKRSGKSSSGKSLKRSK